MSRRYGVNDVHAYLDSCLPLADHRDFEAQLAQDEELKRRVDIWHAQNEAIRLAYGGTPRPRASLSVGRPSNENPAFRAPALGGSRLGVEQFAAPSSAYMAAREELFHGTRSAPEPDGLGSKGMRRVAIAALSALLTALVWGGPQDSRGALLDASAAALRAFGDASAAPLDIATHDPRALTKWLTPRFPAPPPSLVGDLTGWALIGARIVPGAASAAAFIVYENPDHARAGLLIEALDAPPSLGPLPRRLGPIVSAARAGGGFGLAAIGPDAGAVAALIRPQPGGGAP